MTQHMRTILNQSVRVEIPLLIYGVVLGVSIGVTNLLSGEPLDIAEARGIAVGLSTILGAWVGRVVWLLWLKVVARAGLWHRNRIGVLADKVAEITGIVRDSDGEDISRPTFWVRFRFVVPVLMTYVGMSLLAMGCIGTAIYLNTGVYDGVGYLSTLVIGILLLVPGVVIQVASVGITEFRLRKMERLVATLTAPPKIVSPYSRFDDAYEFTKNLIFVAFTWGKGRRVRYGLSG